MAKAMLLLVITLALAGCGNDATLDGKIGGSEATFVEVHGPNQQDEDAEGLSALFEYMSETGIATIFIEDHAVHILVSLDNEEDSGLTLEEALDYTADFIPEDAELLEEGDVLQHQVYVYESELLHEAVGGQDSDTQAFSVRLTGDEEDRHTLAEIKTELLDEEE